MESISHIHKDGVMVGYSNNQLVAIDSREVAEMLGKEHSYVLEMIQGREGKLGIIPVLENANLAVSNYFIQSTYRSGTREYKCYLVTKMGCELLGNKQQGAKGILFTAKYVERFNKMEQAIKERSSRALSPMDQLRLQYQVLEEHGGKIVQIEGKIDDLENNLPLFNVECKELQTLVRKKGIEVLGGKGSQAYKNNSLRCKVYSDIQQQLRREFQVTRYEAIKRCQFAKAKDIIAEYKVPFMLKDEIVMINNQVGFKDVV